MQDGLVSVRSDHTEQLIATKRKKRYGLPRERVPHERQELHDRVDLLLLEAVVTELLLFIRIFKKNEDQVSGSEKREFFSGVTFSRCVQRLQVMRSSYSICHPL